jgi:hypothetical protein
VGQVPDLPGAAGAEPVAGPERPKFWRLIMEPFGPRFLTLLLSVAAADSQTHIRATKGEVSIRYGDAPEQVAALVNRPMTASPRTQTPA